MERNELSAFESNVIHAICEEDVRNRGKKENRSFNVEEYSGRIFPGVLDIDRNRSVEQLERLHLVVRNGQNICLTNEGQKRCIENNHGYIGSYPPPID